jgi:molecular chaperone GrpE
VTASHDPLPGAQGESGPLGPDSTEPASHVTPDLAAAQDEAARAAIDSEVAAASLESDVEVVERRITELTGDLQRIHAEYANYRKRVDRDRDMVREQAMIGVLAELIPVLDDIGRARAHGELEGAFRVVGESLEQVTTRLGLQRYGDVWDAFEPTVHEAIGHETRDDIPPEVAGQVCSAVHQPGYRFGERVVRPALVTVAERG